jgi:hypothetical protein
MDTGDSRRRRRLVVYPTVRRRGGTVMNDRWYSSTTATTTTARFSVLARPSTAGTWPDVENVIDGQVRTGSRRRRRRQVIDRYDPGRLIGPRELLL